MDALTDFPADQQFGGRINRSRCQQPRFQQIRGRCSPLKPVADGKSSTSAVVGVNVQVSFGIIKFVDPGGRHGVGRSQHAEIERCVLHWNGPFHVVPFNSKLAIALDPGVRSQVTDEVFRQSVLAAGVHRTHREPVAVGEDEMSIEPGLRAAWES